MRTRVMQTLDQGMDQERDVIDVLPDGILSPQQRLSHSNEEQVETKEAMASEHLCCPERFRPTSL